MEKNFIFRIYLLLKKVYFFIKKKIITSISIKESYLKIFVVKKENIYDKIYHDK